MDILQREMETNESFIFEVGMYKFFERDDNGYYNFAHVLVNGNGFDMYYRKNYQDIIDWFNDNDSEGYYEYILSWLEVKLSCDFDKLFDDNADKHPNSLLVSIVNFAKIYDLKLSIGDNDSWAILPEEERMYVIELDENFNQALKIFGAELSPSFDVLSNLNMDTNDCPIKIITKNSTYSTNMLYGHFSKTLSFWVDINNLKKEEV